VVVVVVVFEVTSEQCAAGVEQHGGGKGYGSRSLVRNPKSGEFMTGVSASAPGVLGAP
jgi:hypothetical protein